MLVRWLLYPRYLRNLLRVRGMCIVHEGDEQTTGVQIFELGVSGYED